MARVGSDDWEVSGLTAMLDVLHRAYEWRVEAHSPEAAEVRESIDLVLRILSQRRPATVEGIHSLLDAVRIAGKLDPFLEQEGGSSVLGLLQATVLAIQELEARRAGAAKAFLTNTGLR